ncbi:NACHT domain-containing protein [Streptomyces sp. NPDC089799]|uniref:NACHT domain-containing protein n=1 Tax=Streptomyces sp. NPDC089799 TaxID=3155066 RepID=UPI0034130F41
MEPGTIGIRLASSVLGPLVRKLFVSEGPGAGLVDKPVRISGYVSFRGEKRSLTEADVRTLAAKIVKHALRTGGERPIAADEEQAVVDALAATLSALGELTITDLDAVRLGAPEFARTLRSAAEAASGDPTRELTADAAYFHDRLLDSACLHILHFFTQRSTFVAHALVEQTRAVGDLTAKVDELIRRNPLPGAEDAAFEQEYLRYIARKHGKLTIYGIDLNRSPARWPLDVAYLSLEATVSAASPWPHYDDPCAADPYPDGPPDEDPEPPAGPEYMPDELAEQFYRDTFEAAAEASDPEHEEYHRRVNEHLLRSLFPQPADEVLAGSRRVLLRGEAGSGKTTLVQWLAVGTTGRSRTPAMAYLHDRIPFVLTLRTITRNGGRLPAPRDFLGAVDSPLAGSQPAGWEQRVLTAGRGLVLIDGIDEVPERERERTRRWLRDLMEAYDGDNRWLVTSRPSAVGVRWLAEEGFDELTLSAMGPAEVATFIRRWHDAARPDADDPAELDAYQEQLLAAVRTKPDLGRLATNPLMCGLICALHRDRRGYLPHGRKELYDAALSMLIGRRDRERDIEVPELGEDARLDLLQRLAYWLIKNGRTEMDRERAEDIIGRALPAVPELAALGDASAVFGHFLLRSGLLREPAPDTVDFVHKTFQDFLGARAAVEEGDFGLLIGHAADDQWEDVIRMAVALANKRERAEILRGLLEAGDNSTDRPTRVRVYLLASACLEQATVLDPAVREAVRERTASLIPPKTEDEARALAEIGPLALGLLPGPGDTRGSSEAYLVVVAASHVTSDAALPLLARYAEHPSLQVRSQLMWAWSRYDSAAYFEEVIVRLRSDGLRYTVQSAEQLDLLHRLPARPRRLDVRSEVPLQRLESYLAETTLDELVLAHPEVSDLGFLAPQGELRDLRVVGCPALTDLSALGGLPLESLAIGGSPDLRAHPVGPLPELRYLIVDVPADADWEVADLPTGPLLQNLVLRGTALPSGLSGLSRLRNLESLTFGPESGPASEGDWREVRDLPLLNDLVMKASRFVTLPAGAVLPAVSTLGLRDCGDHDVQAVLTRLRGACPRLQRFSLRGLIGEEAELDVAPLADLPHLQYLSLPVPFHRVRNADTLPDGVGLTALRPPP